MIGTHIYTLTEQPSGTLNGSVSFPRKVLYVDWRSWGLKHRPSHEYTITSPSQSHLSHLIKKVPPCELTENKTKLEICSNASYVLSDDFSNKIVTKFNMGRKVWELSNAYKIPGSQARTVHYQPKTKWENNTNM